MSSGGKVFAQHSVTMREALERVAAPYVELGTHARSAAISHSHFGTVVGTAGQPLMIASSCQ